MSDQTQQPQTGFMMVDSTDTGSTASNQPQPNGSFVIADLSGTSGGATPSPAGPSSILPPTTPEPEATVPYGAVTPLSPYPEAAAPDTTLPQSAPSPYQETVVLGGDQTASQGAPPPEQGGVQSFDPTMMPPPPEPVPVDTVVIPPIGSDSQFIPQGLVQTPQGPPPGSLPPPPIPKASGGGIPKILLFVLIGLFVIGGIIAAIFGGSKFLEANKETNLTYWGLWENDAIIAPVIADFEAQNPKIKVQYIKQSQQQYRERLQNAIDRGDGPDLFRYHATWIPMLKNEIQPVPTTIMTPSEFTTKFYKVASADLMAGSTIWGIPLEIDGLGLYINDDLFQNAGATAPTTYEELLQLVPRLTVKNGNDIVTSAIALGTTNNIENFSDILALMILQNGGKLTDPTGREAEEALTFYRKFSTPQDQLYTWNNLLDNDISAFANGRVAMIFAPSWRVFDIKSIKPTLRFHIVPVPQLPGNNITWASYWVEGVSAKSKNQKAAFEFLKFLTSKEEVTKMYTEAAKARLFGEPYALTELGNSLSADPFVSAYLKQADTAHSFPLASRTFDNGINDKMIKYMEDAVNSVTQGSAPSDALNTMAKGFRQVLTNYGLSTSAP